MYVWNNNTVVRRYVAGVYRYYTGSRTPVTFRMGTGLQSSEDCRSCKPVTAVGNMVTVYKATELAETTIPFTLPVALPMRVSSN